MNSRLLRTRPLARLAPGAMLGAGAGARSERRVLQLCAATATAALLAAACGSGAATSAGGKTPLTIVEFQALSGPEAAFFGHHIAAAQAAATVVNAAGPPLGHPLKVASFNSFDDPADAVPAARHMLATESNVLAIFGPGTEVSPSTVPILNAGKIPFFLSSGSPLFDHSTDHYLWRATPADDVTGYAMAVWARSRGYTRAAAVFSNQVGPGEVPDLVRGFTALGGRVVANQTLVLDQPDYRTEVERLVATHPQVIFTETDAQTNDLYMSELRQLNGRLIPVIDDGFLTGFRTVITAAQHALGAAQLSRYWQGVEFLGKPSGSGQAWALYTNALKKDVTGTSDPLQYVTDPYTQTEYDAIMELSLAVIMTKSTNPTTIDNALLDITSPRPGATVVHTYAEGKKLLGEGKSIQYVGVGGPQLYNRYHQNSLPFSAVKVLPNGSVAVIGAVTAQQLINVESKP